MSSNTSKNESTSIGPKLNSTNLYTTVTRKVLMSDPSNPDSWQDLYRLIPYLRNTLSCVVCSNLLVLPFSPRMSECQHHLCQKCRGGRKKIKPACEGCRDSNDYTENNSLQILLQCYKKMCISIVNSPLFKSIIMQASQPGTELAESANKLILIIEEGALFEDGYKSKGGLPESSYSMLPCVLTSSAYTQNVKPQGKENKNMVLNSNTQTRVSFDSVLQPATGSKTSLKIKCEDGAASTSIAPRANKRRRFEEKSVFRKSGTIKPKIGCRCGNASLNPGLLTCGGQRCSCYVDGKTCIECACKGCRNPHRIDGQKIHQNTTTI